MTYAPNKLRLGLLTDFPIRHLTRLPLEMYINGRKPKFSIQYGGLNVYLD